MTTPAASVSRSGNGRLIGRAVWLPVGLLVAIILLVMVLAISITQGAAELRLSTIYEALFAYDATVFDHLIIRTVRLPRVVAGVIIGAGLAVAGALMQGLTTNPLASPDILGISAGAAFAVVLGTFLFGGAPLLVTGVLAMSGAAVAAIIVYALASAGRGGATPAKLTLSGVIFAMFTSAFTTAILILDRNTFEQIRFWTVGSLAGRDWEQVLWFGPLVLVGLIGALLLSRQITTISLGQDVAKGLGQNTAVIKAFAALMVILLAGGSVAIAGPVAFVGLIVPHVARVVCGVDYRWIVPFTAVIGAILVTVADTVGRVVLRPQEIPVGVMLAFVGAPFFIYLARWKIR
ncbi:MAG: iron ABC transporter permease [Chloroflexi bacterium]|nr:iron ABC transporter permease [Ardenticatenaceae bacterium]MBL1128656.1 iron ABC transporter permease [Chloroflexota bacterium]NOG34734.1 iron ABC transporter permease [Chloroflexota bacterium]GIK55055.1 MAG: siderophore ABC transporter permease [Chloroflexota bacterium]